MFNLSSNNMAKNNSLESNAVNHIAQGTKLQGDIETNGDIRVDGVLKGSLNCKGKLVVGETGRIEGELYCTNAHISGSVSGNFRVKELLQLLSTAKLDGDISISKIAVEQGAIINGKLSMGAVVKEMHQNSSEEKQQQKERSA